MGDSSLPTVALNAQMLQKLLTHIKALSPQPDFLFFVGDMVYGGSKVAEQLNNWIKLVEDYYPITMFYTLLGNHENNETAFSNAFSYLPKEQLKGFKKTVYSFDYENSRFIVLNSNRSGSNGSYAITTQQLTWLESTLKSSNMKFNFVMFHVPAFPTGHHYGESLDGSQSERNALWSVLDRYNVTAVFVGHEHNYCRRLIDSTLNINGLSIKNPIYQITTGGGGSALNAHITDVKNALVGPLAAYHYVVLDVNDDGAAIHVYDKDNNIIDSCSLIPNIDNSEIGTKFDILIPMGARWKYLDDGSNQGTLWREIAYDDSTWSSGLAELGYGDGGEATIVSYGSNVYKKYITTYFRKKFALDDASIYSELTLRIQRDDGAIVYLNGTEIYRSNMPSSKISYTTLAAKALNGADEVNYESTTIPPNLLRTGTNVIAVEIHQASASSSDISFDFQLIGNKFK
jgi:hypothetical protein